MTRRANSFFQRFMKTGREIRLPLTRSLRVDLSHTRMGKKVFPYPLYRKQYLAKSGVRGSLNLMDRLALWLLVKTKNLFQSGP